MKNRAIDKIRNLPTPTPPDKSPGRPKILWTTFASHAPYLFLAVLAAGCASTEVTNRHELITGPLPKPGHILIYNFVATPSDLPTDSVLLGEPSLDTSMPQTPEQIAEGRKLGAQIATALVQEIQAMGLPAELASTGLQPQVNDILLRGYLLSVEKGSAAERVVLGFGAGASELRTMVEGFEMTAHGLRKVGSGDVDASGNKTPGAALGVATFLASANPAGLIISSGMKIYGEESGSSTIEGRAKATAKEIAAVLKPRFQQQGWLY